MIAVRVTVHCDKCGEWVDEFDVPSKNVVKLNLNDFHLEADVAKQDNGHWLCVHCNELSKTGGNQ